MILETTTSNKSIIVIAGPTAVGKTATAIDLATHFQTVILSADSRQCYKELDIGVARPSQSELKQIAHYFIASHSIHDKLSAAWYETYALHLLQNLFTQHDVIVVTGGTGLYIKALVEGMDAIPPVEEAIRQEIIETYNKQGIDWLQQQLQAQDPLFASQGEMKNPQRMMRALEVILGTGQSIIEYRNNTIRTRPFQIVQLGIELPRPLLNERIHTRTDSMITAGLEHESELLLPFRHLNALQTVGYKEMFDYFDRRLSLAEAIALIKQNTRRYAKRQMTWFKKQADIHWIDIQNTSSVTALAEKLLNKN